MDSKLPSNEELLKMLPLTKEQLATFVQKINEAMVKSGKAVDVRKIPRERKKVSDGPV